MGNLFSALPGGIAKFALAWLTPSVLSLGLFALFVFPQASELPVLSTIWSVTSGSFAASAVVFSFFAFLSAVLFAYTSLPIYRVLEGLTGPSWVRRRLLRKQVRTWFRLRELQRRQDLGLRVSDWLMAERVLSYPRDREALRPTRFGNALAAMENWGYERYRLDSQALWYELMGVSTEATRRETEESRSPVDFFVSSVAHFSVLAATSLLLGALTMDASVLWVVALSVLLVTFSYHRAIQQIGDWAGSIKAMVALGRRPLASQLGLRIPRTLEREREMWDLHSVVIEYNDDDYVGDYNRCRRSSD